MKILRSFASFFFTLIIYAGLPMIGWGLDDLPGFLSSPPRLGYFISILAFGLLAGYLIQRPGRMGNATGKGQVDKFVPRQRIVRLLVTVMLFGALALVPFADRRDIAVMADSLMLRWIGLGLTLLGMGLIFWSGIALGRLYSPEVTLQNGHRLVTDGPYRMVRHPRYLGGMILGVGLSLLFRSWIGILLTCVFMFIIFFRIKDEEVMMSREFGVEWTTYCEKTRKLIPFVY